MDKTQEKLEQETKKWLEKLEQRIEDRDSSVEQMENVLAYRDDTYHFLGRKRLYPGLGSSYLRMGNT